MSPDPALAHLTQAITDGRVRIGQPGDGEHYDGEEDHQ